MWWQRKNNRKNEPEEKNVFEKVEEWCLRHPDPMKRHSIGATLQLGQYMAILRHRLSTEHGMSPARINQEIEAEFGEMLPWNHWIHALPALDDPRLIALTAIVSAKMNITEIIPALEECLERIDSAPMRETVALAFGTLKRLETRSCLTELATDSDPVVSDAAMWALQQLPSEDDAEQELVEEFRGFMDGITADDFVRYGHYHQDEED